jgi:uncharacterized protein YjbI with pentapeptide repeats
MEANVLISRWLTADGMKRRAELLKLLREPEVNWALALSGFVAADQIRDSADLRGIDFSGERLSKADLTYCAMDLGKLDGCDLVCANFYGTTLRAASLCKSNSSRGGLVSVEAAGARFDGANLSGCYALGAVLRCASFRGANLEWATLANAQCDCADFRDACLRHTELRHVNLLHADFTGARLDGADFTGARR